MFEHEINQEGIEEAGIVFGLCSYNESENISHAASQLDTGLRRYHSDKKCVIINCDNDSPDDTKGVFLNTETSTPKIYITTPPGVAGKGYNLENLFRKAHQLGAKTVVCVDADIKSITPEWVTYFTKPILDGHDFVTPNYARHKYDGTITNTICFPLIYGILCTDIRQPIGGDFALSGRFTDYILMQPWHRTTGQYGIDIFLTLKAILGGFKVAQTGLGSKIHKPSAPKLGPMFLQVIGTAFRIIIDDIRSLNRLKEVNATEKFGKGEMDKAQDLEIDRDDLKRKIKAGQEEHIEEMKRYLQRSTFDDLNSTISSNDEGVMQIDEDLWVKIVYDMIAAFNIADNTEAALETFRVLYFARTLTFINKTWNWPTTRAETLNVKQAERFFEMRSYLFEIIGDLKLET